MKRKPRKYQLGGKEPIYTSNPKDPRIKAYNDSLELHNKAKKLFYDETYKVGSGFSPVDRKEQARPYNKKDGWTKAAILETLKEEYNNVKDPIPKEYLKSWSKEAIKAREKQKELYKKALDTKNLPTGYFPIEGFSPSFKKPVQPVIYKKSEPVKTTATKKAEEVVQQIQKVEQPPLTQYSGNPVYDNTPYSRGAGALIGFENKGDTTYIAPEDYERFAVPNYARKTIESKTDMMRKPKKYYFGGKFDSEKSLIDDKEVPISLRQRYGQTINPNTGLDTSYLNDKTLLPNKQEAAITPADPGMQFQIDPSKLLRGLNFGIGAIADEVNEAKNTAQEREEYFKTLRTPEDTEFIQNDIPLYTKYGGGFPRDKALKILRDKEVNGKPLTDKQRKFFAMMAFAKKKAEEGGGLSRSEIEKRLALEDKLRFEKSLPENQGKRYNWYERNIKNPLEKMGVDTDALEFGIEGASSLEGVALAAKLAKVGLKKLATKGAKNSEELVRGNINWYDEPGFKARNPNFNPEAYVNDAGKFGKYTTQGNKELTPFDLKQLPSLQREAYKAKQSKILSDKYNNPLEEMKEGGIPERYKKMGFTRVGQKKDSTRSEKKWMVLAEKGGKYKVVHGGAKGMSDYTKHKDEDRKDRFWKRHNGGAPGKSKDPFSPLYWHKKFGTWQEGGDIPEVLGLPDEMMDQAWIEAEAGEIYKQPDGQIMKISEDGDRHEDGGELIDNVEKVLEDTSTTRKDKRSQALAVTPKAMMDMFGIVTNKNLSHSEALEFVEDKVESKTKSIKRKIDKSLENIKDYPNNIYAKNSAELSLKELEKYPSEQDIFEVLFQHQESIKTERDMKKAKYGIYLPKAQDGLELLYKKANSPKASKADILAFQKAFHADPTTKKYAQELVSKRGAITRYGKERGYGQSDIRQNEDGLMGDTTRQYIKYFEDNQVLPNLPDVVLPKLNLKEEEDSIEPPVDPNATKTQSTAATTKVDDEEPMTFNRTQYSDFNEPLMATDIIAPAAGYLSADRIPANYNPVQFKKINPRLENVLPYLQQGQRDFNALAKQMTNNSQGQANAVNMFAKKYAIDTQTIAGVTDRNLQREASADIYNAQVSDKQSVADQQSRAVFEQQQLMGKEAQRRQKLQSLDELMQRVNLNRKQNREGDLLMKLFPNFNSRGEFNGNNRYFTAGVPQTSGQAKNSPANRYIPFSATDGAGRQVPMVFDVVTGKPVPVSVNQNNVRTQRGVGR